MQEKKPSKGYFYITIILPLIIAFIAILSLIANDIKSLKTSIAEISERQNDATSLHASKINDIEHKLNVIEQKSSEPRTIVQQSDNIQFKINQVAAIVNLREQIQSGDSYIAELQLAESLNSNLDFSKLKPLAEIGVEDAYDLRIRFEKIRGYILDDVAITDESTGWMDKMIAVFKSSINLEKNILTDESDDKRSILARVDQAMHDQNYAKSIAEIETLDEKSKKEFSSWLIDAKNMQSAYNQIDQIYYKSLK